MKTKLLLVLVSTLALAATTTAHAATSRPRDKAGRHALKKKHKKEKKMAPTLAPSDVPGEM